MRRRLTLFGSELTTMVQEITSVVFLDLDDDMRIVQLTDQWNGEEHTTRWRAEFLRRLFAKVLSWTARVLAGHKGR